MSLRARIFIIVSILVFFVLVVSIFLIVRQKKINAPVPQVGVSGNSSSAQNNGQPSNPNAVGEQAPAGVSIKKPTSIEVEKNAVEQLAKVFIERYGTFSTDNNFQNIKDVSTLVTQSLWSKISASISSKPATGSAQSFDGVTTKVINADLTAWSDSKASVELKLTRTEEKNGSVSTRYQNVSLELVKTDSLWLVDKVTWH
ncbi:MAG TPA: hypothetical protein VLK22_04475 [Candidatus Udaeobacter sp.]|nr:hypothetical protein [Candidatus Udaeobacter sp.]